MMKKINPKTILAIVVFACTLATGQVSAGYMGFTADSLRIEDSGGC